MAVYKDKKTGKWYFRVYVDDPITGNRMQKTRKGFELRREALDAESILVAQYQNQEAVIDDISVNDLIDEFLSFQKRKLKTTTFIGYEYQINRHIRPIFQNVKLRNVSKDMLDTWYNELTKQTYSHNYKNKLLLRLKSIFDYAADQYNYRIRYLNTMTSFKKQHGDIERQVTIYTEKDFSLFINQAKDLLEKTLFMTFYYTGMRVGELRGLKWNDINFKLQTISIERQVTSKIPRQGPTTITPKSESSIREIQIPNLLINQLQIWKKDRMQYSDFKKSWQVFGDDYYITENRIRRAATRMSNDAELPHIKLHDFRHSYTTLLHNKGIDPKIIQAQAGHSTVQITLDTYTHITTNQKKQAIIDVFENTEKE